jgi:3-oxoacyl-[acyl-carrier-protein] synthase II
MELASYRHIFGERKLPVFSLKGAIGHTLGAAGGIEAAACLNCLSYDVIPPTTGFSVPEDGADGMVSSRTVEGEISCILSTNSGFNGVNGAVVMGKGAVA